MVLLVHPHQEGFVVVVPDAACVGPVTRHAGAGQQRRHRLVEQEVVLNQLLLLLVGHLGQWVVLALELAIQAVEGVGGDLLDLSALCSGAVRRQTDPLDAASCTHTAAVDVLLVKDTALEFSEVQICGVLGVGAVAAVPGVDDRVQQILEHLVGLLVTGHAAHSHDERVTCTNTTRSMYACYHMTVINVSQILTHDR